MEDRPTSRRMLVVVASVSACLLAVGCSGDNGADGFDPASLQPLDGIDSPEISAPPSGSITSSPSGLHSTTFDASTRSVVALTDDSRSMQVFDADLADAAPRVITLPAAASDIVTVGDGSVLLPMQDQLARVDLRSSSADIGDDSIDILSVDGNLLSAAMLNDGRIAAGDDRGSIHMIDPATNESQVVDGLTSVDALAVTEFGMAALDRRQTSLTQVDIEAESLSIALRAGTGAAKLDTDNFGRILVTDAAGSELLVFSSDDLLLRQRFPVGAQPWAVTYDDVTNVVWVSTPGDNQVVGYTLDTGIPVEVGRFATVRQPDSIAVDSDTGTLFVGSASGSGLQRISVEGVV